MFKQILKHVHATFTKEFRKVPTGLHVKAHIQAKILTILDAIQP